MAPPGRERRGDGSAALATPPRGFLLSTTPTPTAHHRVALPPSLATAALATARSPEGVQRELLVVPPLRRRARQPEPQRVRPRARVGGARGVPPDAGPLLRNVPPAPVSSSSPLPQPSPATPLRSAYLAVGADSEMWVKIDGVNGDAINVGTNKGTSAKISSAGQVVGYEGCTNWGTLPTTAQTNFGISAHVRPSSSGGGGGSHLPFLY